MHSTPASLLERLRRPGDRRAWDRFVELYAPLIYYWACRTGLRAEDTADLGQDVFATLLEKMPGFVYDPGKSFRAWLRTLVLNKWRDHRRRSAAAARRAEKGPLDDVPAQRGRLVPASAPALEGLCACEMKIGLATRPGCRWWTVRQPEGGLVGHLLDRQGDLQVLDGAVDVTDRLGRTGVPGDLALDDAEGLDGIAKLGVG